jgi:hypothetical protein
MKQLIALCVFLMLVSCKSNELTDSFILFSEAQPAKVEAVTSFPEKYIGEYSFDYSHRIVVEPKQIILKDLDLFEMTKSEFDSIPNTEIRDGNVYDKENGKSYKTLIKGDTISWEIPRFDTIFNFNEGETAKLFKQSIILNKEKENGIQVSYINFKGLVSEYVQLGTRKDYHKLKSKLKLNPTVIMENNDTLNVVLTPSRGDFRKLLRMDFFEYQTSFLK